MVINTLVLFHRKYRLRQKLSLFHHFRINVSAWQNRENSTGKYPLKWRFRGFLLPCKSYLLRGLPMTRANTVATIPHEYLKPLFMDCLSVLRWFRFWVHSSEWAFLHAQTWDATLWLPGRKPWLWVCTPYPPRFSFHLSVSNRYSGSVNPGCNLPSCNSIDCRCSDFPPGQSISKGWLHAHRTCLLVLLAVLLGICSSFNWCRLLADLLRVFGVFNWYIHQYVHQEEETCRFTEG